MSTDDRPGADTEGGSTAKPDRVDAYLSRKAQLRLDPSAIVAERADGTWQLSISGQPMYALGDSFGRAKQALWALIQAKAAAKK